MLIAAVGIAGVAAFFGLDYWHEQERKRVDWERIVREFKNCSMSSALFAMGYRSGTYEVSLGDAISEIWAEKNPVTSLLTAGVKDGRVRDIDQIWLDPSIPYSVSTEKGASTSSINLLSQCESRINDGKLKTWLDVGIYYLVVGHPKAVEWLTKAGEVGIADAYVLLGHAHRRNLISSVKDEKQAFDYYLKAARMGSIKGQIYVAELLHTVNPSQARRYLIAAAEGGSRTAAYLLQQLHGPYSMPTINQATTAQALRSAYFWSLVFDFLASQGRSTALDAIVDGVVGQENSGSLYENPEEYEFEGLPPTPWDGTPFKYSKILDSAVVSESKIVRNYNYQAAKENLAALEVRLDVDSRIAVQGVAKKWIGERAEQSYDKPQIQQAEFKTPKSEKLPSWKPYPLAVCDGKSATSEQSGSDLFRSFKPYIWAVSASAKGSNDEAEPVRNFVCEAYHEA